MNKWRADLTPQVLITTLAVLLHLNGKVKSDHGHRVKFVVVFLKSANKALAYLNDIIPPLFFRKTPKLANRTTHALFVVILFGVAADLIKRRDSHSER